MYLSPFFEPRTLKDIGALVELAKTMREIIACKKRPSPNHSICNPALVYTHPQFASISFPQVHRRSAESVSLKTREKLKRNKTHSLHHDTSDLVGVSI